MDWIIDFAVGCVDLNGFEGGEKGFVGGVGGCIQAKSELCLLLLQ